MDFIYSWFNVYNTIDNFFWKMVIGNRKEEGRVCTLVFLIL